MIPILIATLGDRRRARQEKPPGRHRPEFADRKPWPELRDSLSPDRDAPGALTSAGATEGGAALPGSCAPVPVDPNADVPAAAAETAGGRNSDQDVGN